MNIVTKQEKYIELRAAGFPQQSDIYFYVFGARPKYQERFADEFERLTRNLCPKDAEFFLIAEDLAFTLAEKIGEELCVFEPKRRASGALGLCYVSERRIAINFRGRNTISGDGKGWAGRWESQGNCLKTVCHEVAHLKHPNHGAKFKALEKELVEFLETEILGSGK